MSMFSGVEKDEPSAGGIFGRLKSLRAGFVGESSAMPIIGAEARKEPVHEPVQKEPRFRTTSKPVAPSVAASGQPMTLGMRLQQMADVEDVEAHEEFDARADSAAHYSPENASTAENDVHDAA